MAPRHDGCFGVSPWTGEEVGEKQATNVILILKSERLNEFA